jgi:hypothetical protein
LLCGKNNNAQKATLKFYIGDGEFHGICCKKKSFNSAILSEKYFLTEDPFAVLVWF